MKDKQIINTFHDLWKSWQRKVCVEWGALAGERLTFRVIARINPIGIQLFEEMFFEGVSWAAAALSILSCNVRLHHRPKGRICEWIDNALKKVVSLIPIDLCTCVGSWRRSGWAGGKTRTDRSSDARVFSTPLQPPRARNVKALSVCKKSGSENLHNERDHYRHRLRRKR
jgi:hypothetical protein